MGLLASVLVPLPLPQPEEAVRSVLAVVLRPLPVPMLRAALGGSGKAPLPPSTARALLLVVSFVFRALLVEDVRQAPLLAEDARKWPLNPVVPAHIVVRTLVGRCRGHIHDVCYYD